MTHPLQLRRYDGVDRRSSNSNSQFFPPQGCGNAGGNRGGRAAMPRRARRLGQGLEFLEMRQLLTSIPLVTPDLVIASGPFMTDSNEVLHDAAFELMRITDFRNDPLFSDFRGHGYTAVVIDTGIDINHPFFGPDNNNDGISDRIIDNFDFAGCCGLPEEGDTADAITDRHGTHVSGVVASSDTTFPGVAPDVNLIHLKVFMDQGGGTFFWLEQALQWVIAHVEEYNIVAVNMSVGDGLTHTEPVVGAAAAPYGLSEELQTLRDMGVISVGSAGNWYYSTQGLNYPAADPNVISVGAVYSVNPPEDQPDLGYVYAGGWAGIPCIDCITPFTQRHETMLDILAPGGPIISSIISEGAEVGEEHGTSQATPFITGAAILAQEIAEEALGRRLTVTEFRDLLRQSGDPIVDSDFGRDNVLHTDLTFPRANLHSLGKTIMALRDPQPSIQGTATVEEGHPYVLDLDVKQQGVGQVQEWVIDWGDGTIDVVQGAALNAEHVFDDGPATYTINAIMVDQFGQYTVAPINVSVENVAPVPTITAAPNNLVGQAFSLGLHRGADPGNDSVSQWIIQWGDGATEVLFGDPTSASYTYSLPGTYTINATLVDEDGQYTVAPIQVVSGHVIAEGPDRTPEGNTYQLAISASPFIEGSLQNWIVNWGDGGVDTLPGDASIASHFYSDGFATFNITITATDGSNTYVVPAKTLLVEDVAPTFHIVGSETVSESEIYQLALNALDPGSDPIIQWSVDWGDGNAVVLNGTATSASHAYLDGPHLYNIAVTAINSDGPFTAPLVGVHVNDVAPLVAIDGPGFVNEGDVFALDLHATDVGMDSAIEWIINWGDGSVETVLGSPSQAFHTYADGPLSVDITAQVRNEDGVFMSNQHRVDIQNVATTIAATGANSVAEGAAYTLDLFQSEPGADPIVEWTIDWGDGSVEVLGGSVSAATHVYADDAPLVIISVSAANDDGVYSAAPLALSVSNVIPELVVSGNSTALAGTPYSLLLSAADPGLDTISNWTIDWGDGTVQVVPGSTLVVTHEYGLGSGSVVVTASASDEDGVFDATPLPLNVVFVEISGSSTASEGVDYVLTLTSSPLIAETLTQWTIHWGDGTSTALSGDAAFAQHIYPDGRADFQIVGEATDGSNSFTTLPVTVTVEDVAPQVTIAGIGTVLESDTYVLTLQSQDVGQDVVTGWTIFWGDGTVEELSGDRASATHIYQDGPNLFAISAVAHNDDGQHSSNLHFVQVTNSEPVIAILGNGNGQTGMPYRLDLLYTDSGQDSVQEWIVNWGDGSESRFDGTVSHAIHNYAAIGNYAIVAQATDDDGQYIAVLLDVSIVAGPPLIGVSGLETAEEGVMYVMQLAWDADSESGTSQWEINWGDGTVETLTGNPTVATHTFLDGPGAVTINATATDDNGTYQAAPLLVQVTNVAPTLSVSGAASALEGATYQLDLSASDVGTDTVSSWTIHWGDGQSEVVLGSPATVTHTYLDDGPAYAILVEATDEDGIYGANGPVVAVQNVDPTLQIQGIRSALAGQAYQLQLSSVDPGLDTIASWTINWGDGQIETVSGNLAAASHIYNESPLERVITATAVDDDGTYLALPEVVFVHKPTLQEADLNDDGSVDAADAAAMFANWGGQGIGDLTTDGIVDAADAGVMFSQWTGDSLGSVARALSWTGAASGTRTSALPSTVDSSWDGLLETLAQDVSQQRNRRRAL